MSPSRSLTVSRNWGQQGGGRGEGRHQLRQVRAMLRQEDLMCMADKGQP